MNVKKNNILVKLFLIFTVILMSGCVQQQTTELTNDDNSNNSKNEWNEYFNDYYSDYTIKYPENMQVSEIGQNHRRTVISTQDYEIDITSGKIVSGFKINLVVYDFNSLDNLFYCDSDLTGYANCLLSFSETSLGDYKKGEFKFENTETVDGCSIDKDGCVAKKYEFVSNIGENNNIGVVVNKDNKCYLVLIAYRDFKDMELFNEILNSFEFKN